MSDQQLAENIINILSIARLAPSVHNSQPWEVKVNRDVLEIRPARSRQLQSGDPTGRQTEISLGIFVEACLIALEAHGLKASSVTLSNKDDIKIKVAAGEVGRLEEAAYLKSRFTDRSIYRQASISSTQKKDIEAAWQSPDIEIRVVTDEIIIEKAAALTRQALLLALTSPDFRKELAHHLVTSRRTPYGIPLSTLKTPKAKAVVTKLLVKSGISRKADAELEYKRWKSASALVLVLSSGDSFRYWRESGQAYLRASLAINKSGFSQATSAALVEAADFHEDIEKMLKTQKRLQCVLRVGHGQKKQLKSGRFQPEKLLAT